MSCGAPDQSAPLSATAVSDDAFIIAGKVLADTQPVAGAFARLLDSSGEFTAEVVTSAEGDFRFFITAGDWTVRVLHRSGSGSETVQVSQPGQHIVDVKIEP